ncbi:peptidoglycan DD-metalloendopeptidase family protein [Pseudaeromonas paramecii]|uniref:Peptidoglycan DD-metalloendopeptidase family protein n=1 Tax=Pseudaeromonas paramecii TaxID=2138166 RepID=A0ABP8QAA1_9GAMM
MRLAFALSLLWLLAACSNSSPAPVRDAGHKAAYASSGGASKPTRSPTLTNKQYRVKAGDTLYSIAWGFGIDFRALASFNKITPPYAIYVGQIINLDLDNPDAGRYVVKRGDSLSSIARRHGTSLNNLVRFNNLKKPYVIHPGQLIVLGTAHKATGSGGKDANLSSHSVRAVDQRSQQSGNKSFAGQNGKEYAQTKSAQASNKSLTWRWPSSGRIVQGFSLKEQGNKGIDIAGKRGQPIYAAAAGRVVYAGSALRGYGNLVIIKHDDDYLSAYAHNEVLRVTEQQEVKAGQQIADMGSSDTSDVRLHFEIRYRGQSVNPLGYLPKR